MRDSVCASLSPLGDNFDGKGKRKDFGIIIISSDQQTAIMTLHVGAYRRAVQLLSSNICGESSHPGHIMGMVANGIVPVTDSVVAVDAQVSIGRAATARCTRRWTFCRRPRLWIIRSRGGEGGRGGLQVRGGVGDCWGETGQQVFGPGELLVVCWERIQAAAVVLGE